jgi:hypothetical protein
MLAFETRRALHRSALVARDIIKNQRDEEKKRLLKMLRSGAVGVAGTEEDLTKLKGTYKPEENNHDEEVSDGPRWHPVGRIHSSAFVSRLELTTTAHPTGSSPHSD